MLARFPGTDALAGAAGLCLGGRTKCLHPSLCCPNPQGLAHCGTSFHGFWESHVASGKVVYLPPPPPPLCAVIPVSV